MDDATGTEIREAVRERYARAAREVSASCCSTPARVAPESVTPESVTPELAAPELFGAGLYGDETAEQVPDAALAASLGCGNPTLLAELRPGEVVLDLGSGGGIDGLLSARRVGPSGKAYGLDMTPEMLELARRNQDAAGVTNVEFLLGTIEDVPLPDASVDVIISNCVINLSADKDAVFREAFRVLRPGGRFAVSDVVLRRPLPEAVQGLVAAWTGCIAGALLEDDYRARLEAAGFTEVEVQPTRVFDRADLGALAADLEVPDTLDVEQVSTALDGAVMSAFVRAHKTRPTARPAPSADGRTSAKIAPRVRPQNRSTGGPDA